MPVIGAVSSQIGAAANIISSVSAAGAKIISVGEPYMAKHAQESVVSMPPSSEENGVQMSPIESPAVAMVTNVTGNASNTPPQISPAIFDVTPQYFQPMQPLPVPIVPKSNHPERRILRVKRPGLRQKSAMYEKDEVDELGTHGIFEYRQQRTQEHDIRELTVGSVRKRRRHFREAKRVRVSQ